MSLEKAHEQIAKPRALILAAGYGKRMGALTQTLPKPLLPAGNATLLDYTLFQLYRWGIQKVFINVHYLSEKIIHHLDRYSHFEFQILYEPEILGTGGALRTVYEQLADDSGLIVINPDRIFFSHENYPPQLSPYTDASLHVLEKPAGSLEPGWELQNNVWRMNRAGGRFFYCGLSILRPSIVKDFALNTFFELGPVLENVAQRDRLQCIPFSGVNFDAGVLTSYQQTLQNFYIPEYARDDWQRFLQINR